MKRQLAVVCFLSTAAIAQVTQPLRPFPTFSLPPVLGSEIQQYLGLTASQVDSVNRLNRRFADFQMDKSRRQFVVRSEIADETSRDVIDSIALGLRYRELQLIDREVEAERTKTRSDIQALLTPAQKTKIVTLNEALQLQNAACAAIDNNLMAPTPTLTVNRIADPASIAGLLLGLGPGNCGSALSRVGLPGLLEAPAPQR